MKLIQLTAAIVMMGICGWAWAAQGFGIPYEKQPRDGLIVAGQPTLEQLQALKAKGYTTVINLRRKGEFDDFDEAAEVTGMGMAYVHIPVKNVESIRPGDADLLHAAISGADGPVLLHCTIGWRAGSLLGIEQYLKHGASRKEALDVVAKAHMDHAAEDVEDWLDDYESK